MPNDFTTQGGTPPLTDVMSDHVMSHHIFSTPFPIGVLEGIPHD